MFAVSEGVDRLRSLFKILILFLVIMLIGIYSNKELDETSKQPDRPSVNSGQVKPVKQAVPEARPETGIGALIGKPVSMLLEKYGEPVRKEPSAYGYEWWVYPGNKFYLLAGVEKGHVVTSYAAGEMDTAPFQIGRSSNEIFQTRYPEAEVILKAHSSLYRFELSEEELNIRPLIPVGNFFAQLYIDQLSGTLSAVRFLSKDVLLKTKPYELVYEGALPEAAAPGRSLWVHIERGAEAQLADLIALFRKQNKLPPLEWDAELSAVAKSHSKNMVEKQFFSHESPEFGEVTERLENKGVSPGAAGEQIAASYMDAPAAFEAWLNSREDRELLLGDSFSFFGTGAYRTHYTQIFTETK